MHFVVDNPTIPLRLQDTANRLPGILGALPGLGLVVVGNIRGFGFRMILGRLVTHTQFMASWI